MNTFKEIDSNKLNILSGGAIGGGIAGGIIGGAVGATGAAISLLDSREVNGKTIWKGYTSGALTGAGIGTLMPF